MARVPLASGLLPICLGEATKISAYLLEADKYYRVLIRLGVSTTTGDADGEVIAEREVPEISDEQFLAVLERFSGDISQIPPMHSAVKQAGKPLYLLARRGIEVERRPRRVKIFRFEMIGRDSSSVSIDVHCSKGTYIRTLAEDIGHVLGCGAHVAALRRLKVGPFNGAGMISLDEMVAIGEKQGLVGLDAELRPMETALEQWPGVQLSDEVACFLKQGQAVLVPHAPTQGWVKIFGR